MGLRVHEWYLLFAGAVLGGIWTYVAFALTFDTGLVESLQQSPLGWLGLVLVSPALAVMTLGSWLYQQGVGADLGTLIVSVALLWGALPALALIVWLRRRGV